MLDPEVLRITPRTCHRTLNDSLLKHPETQDMLSTSLVELFQFQLNKDTMNQASILWEAHKAFAQCVSTGFCRKHNKNDQKPMLQQQLPKAEHQLLSSPFVTCLCIVTILPKQAESIRYD